MAQPERRRLPQRRRRAPPSAQRRRVSATQRTTRPPPTRFARRTLWDIPKGVAEPGEQFAAAAVRELQEETGLAAPPDALRRNERKLIFRHAQSLQNLRSRNLRRALVAVCKCVGRENVGRIRDAELSAVSGNGTHDQ